jgi:hypothetical protein
MVGVNILRVLSAKHRGKQASVTSGVTAQKLKSHLYKLFVEITVRSFFQCKGFSKKTFCKM